MTQGQSVHVRQQTLSVIVRRIRTMRWKHSFWSFGKNVWSLSSRVPFRGFARLTLVATALLLLRKLYYQHIRRTRHYPPGHNGLPFVGCLLTLIKSLFLQDSFLHNGKSNRFLDSLKDKYGDMALIQIGCNWALVINDLRLCRQLLGRPEFMMHDLELTDDNSDGFPLTNGRHMFFRRHLAQRSFIQTMTNDYLNTNVENLMNKVVFPAFDELARANAEARKRGETVRDSTEAIHEYVRYSMFALVFTAMFGDELVDLPAIDSPGFSNFLNNAKWLVLATVSITLRVSGVTSMPYTLRHCFQSMFKTSVEVWVKQALDARNLNNLNRIRKQTTRDVAEAGNAEEGEKRNEPKTGDRPRTSENEEQKEKETETETEHENEDSANERMATILHMFDAMDDPKNNYPSKQVIADACGLFMAGYHGTTVMAMQGLQVLATIGDCPLTQNMKNMQDTIHAELLGMGAESSLCELVHLRAFVYENCRVVAFRTPILGVPRTILAKNGVKVGDYHVPYKTMVIPNYSMFGQVEEYWGESGSRFDLNNWTKMDPKTKQAKFVMNSAFSTFGIRRRNCPGQALAIRELTIFFANLLKRYKFTNGGTRRKIIVIERRATE